MKLISEGAEARIYAVKMLGIAVVVKDRIRKPYREKMLDAKIREQRTRTEAKILARASEKGIRVPKVLLLEKYRMTMEKIEGRMLNSMQNNTGTITQCARQLAALHSISIAHGDYTPANILVDNEGRTWVIDFGLGEITDSVEEKALDVLLMKRSISDRLFSVFEKSYLSSSGASGKRVLNQLSEIEKRGRYQERTLASIG